MKDKRKLFFWLSTLLFSVMIIAGAIFYFVQNDMVKEVYLTLGYPTYLVYPVAIAKFLGIAAILSRKSYFLKELAYAGFFYLLILGVMAHVQASDGGFAPALAALVLLCISYCSGKKLK
jgi:hypothetical protein